MIVNSEGLENWYLEQNPVTKYQFFREQIQLRIGHTVCRKTDPLEILNLLKIYFV